MRCDPIPPGLKAVKSWVRRAGEKPSVAKLATNEKAKGNRTDRLDPKVREMVETLIDTRYLARPPISLVSLHSSIEATVDDHNKHHTAKLSTPSLEAVRDAVGRRDQAEVVAAREGKARADQLFSGSRRQKDPEAPLDVVELDHTTSDLMVVDDREFLPIGRANVAWAVDRCTRMPFGLCVTFEPPSAHTVMQCLRNGILPKLYVDDKRRSGEWKLDHDWPVCGRPRTLVLDRALENLGNDLPDLAGELGFHLRFTPRKKPRNKGGIERYLRTMNQEFLHQQRGTTFSNVLDRRDYDPAKNAVITFDELLYLLHRWALDVYACDKHKGIRDVPRRRWDELTVRYPVDPIESVEELEPLFGRVAERTLTRLGIAFEYIEYYSDDLVSVLSDPEFRAACPDRHVQFKWNPGDLGRIWVRLPHTREYLPVGVAEPWEDYAPGLSIWQHRNIVRFENKRADDAIDHAKLARAKADLSDPFRSFWETRRGVRGRSRAARHDGLGRMSPAGASADTSPPGSVDAARRAASASAAGRSARAAPGRRAGSPESAGTALQALVQATPLPSGVGHSEHVDVYAKARD